MSKIRVYQLAKELGLSTKEVIERLVKAGVSVKSHSSSVDEAVARAALSKEELSETKREAPPESPPEPEHLHGEVSRSETPVMEEPVSPSAPKVVTIPETITVKELSEQAAISPSEIIKTLMKMGITATVNQNLDPELAKQVAVEFGFTVEIVPVEEVEEFVGDVDDPICLAPPEPLPAVEPDRNALSVEESLSIPKLVKIPETITVKRLSEQAAISPSEIIKTLMKMGITATVNQNLDPELAKQVAVEFGFTVEIVPVEEVEQDSGAAKVEVPDIPWLELSTAMRARGAHESAVGTDRPTASSDILSKKLWLLAGTIVAMVLLTLAVPREKGTPSPEATAPVVDEGPRSAAIPPTKGWSSTTEDVHTYRKDIKPLMAAYCHKCHGRDGVAAGIRLETYRQVSRYVVPGRSEESRLYTFIQQRKNHVNPWPRSWGHTTNDKLALIKDWIDVDWAEE